MICKTTHFTFDFTTILNSYLEEHMWFKKNNVNKAFQSFQFLSNYGFTLKRYLRAPDEERVYSLNNIILEVNYYWGIYPDGKDSMCVAVVLTVNDCRKNLLKSDRIFDADLLKALKTSVDAVTPIEQIPIYADFMKTNIDTLLEHRHSN